MLLTINEFLQGVLPSEECRYNRRGRGGDCCQCFGVKGSSISSCCCRCVVNVVAAVVATAALGGGGGGGGGGNWVGYCWNWL